MSDVYNVYSPKELEGLSDSAKKKLQSELNKQIKASREVRALISAHDELNASLKDKLRKTYNKLKRK
jgi:uncharacterized membrane-anchored protein YhcB (DUF1043 family)